MPPLPSVTIKGQPYELTNLTSTAYIRLAVIIKPMDGTPLSELTLDDPNSLQGNLKTKAIADREKVAFALQERLGDDITTRRLAYALKSMCPSLAEAKLVIYNHVVRPDDYAQIEFDVNLELMDILNITAEASNWLVQENKKQKQPVGITSAPHRPHRRRR